MDKVNILIVDDKPANVVSLQAILQCPEYNLVSATSGMEALRHTLHWEFAVILLDVMMPEMDGFEVARLIKQRASVNDTPIIFLTAIATDFRYLQEGYAVGAVDYLQKPLDPAIVRAKVAVFAELYRRNERIKHQELLLREAQRVEQERRLNETLAAGELHYRALAESLPQIIFAADASGAVRYFNRRWYDYTGLEGEDACSEAGRLRVMHPDDAPVYQSSWQQASADRIEEIEIRFREAASGTYRWHLCRALPERNSGGELVGWVGTLTDIHEQKRKEQMQRLVAEISVQLSSCYDAEQTLPKLAASLAEFIDGYAMIDLALPARPFRRIVAGALPGEQAPVLQARLEASALRSRHALLLTDPADAAAALGLPTDEAPCCSSLVSAPIYVRGETAGSITCIGIAARHRVDRLDLDLAVDAARHAGLALENALLYQETLDANRRKDEFLAILSHELRTPLNAVLGWTELLKLDTDDPKILEGLEVVERNGKILSQLVADLLDVSRIVTGKLELHKTPIDLREFVGGVLATIQPLADDKNLELALALADRPLVVFGDQERLQQVLSNLLVNAIKFTPPDGTIELALDATDLGVRLTLTDSGIGIDPALMPYVFERFRQADSSSTRRYGGLGLGLAIVKHIVELHGGRVAVASEGPGRGAQFSVLLPYGDGEEPVASRLGARAAAPSPRLDGTTIVLVDDDASSRTVAATFLRHSGAAVRVAGSVDEALRTIRSDVPDIVLTDIGMPEQDGYELLRQLRDFSAEVGQPVRAAALTAYASVEDAARAKDAGFDLYLTKPINASDLVAAIGRLSRSEAGR